MIGEIAIVLFGLVIAGGLVVRSVVRTQAKTQSGPELAHAMRLLDQVLASDNAIPQLPRQLKNDITKTVGTYYREIEA